MDLHSKFQLPPQKRKKSVENLHLCKPLLGPPSFLLHTGATCFSNYVSVVHFNCTPKTMALAITSSVVKTQLRFTASASDTKQQVAIIIIVLITKSACKVSLYLKIVRQTFIGICYQRDNNNKFDKTSFEKKFELVGNLEINLMHCAGIKGIGNRPKHKELFHICYQDIVFLCILCLVGNWEVVVAGWGGGEYGVGRNQL